MGSVAEKLEEYLRDNIFLVGVHIRSVFLKRSARRTARGARAWEASAQDFLDCALSLHRYVYTSKPVRYYLATDSEKIAEEWLATVPNSTEFVGPVMHSGDLKGRDGLKMNSAVREQQALYKVMVDFFVMLQADFAFHTFHSMWSTIDVQLRSNSNRSGSALQLQTRPPWCDDHSASYTVHTH